MNYNSLQKILKEATESTYEKYLSYAKDEILLKELLQQQAELNKEISNAIIHLSSDIDSNSRNLDSLRYGTYYTG